MTAEVAQETLVYGGHVQVERVVLYRRRHRVVRPQRRHHLAYLADRGRPQPDPLGQQGFELRDLCRGRQKHDRTPAHQRRVGEAGGRMLKKRAR